MLLLVWVNATEAAQRTRVTHFTQKPVIQQVAELSHTRLKLAGRAQNTARAWPKLGPAYFLSGVQLTPALLSPTQSRRTHTLTHTHTASSVSGFPSLPVLTQLQFPTRLLLLPILIAVTVFRPLQQRFSPCPLSTPQ